MESAEAKMRRLKVNWTFDMVVGTTNESELWVHFFEQPWFAINLGSIPYDNRQHLKMHDRLVMSLDMEPRNHAQPSQPPVE